jgi:predicted DNA-binding protein (MmcQ/YjbR family)
MVKVIEYKKKDGTIGRELRLRDMDFSEEIKVKLCYDAESVLDRDVKTKMGTFFKVYSSMIEFEGNKMYMTMTEINSNAFKRTGAKKDDFMLIKCSPKTSKNGNVYKGFDFEISSENEATSTTNEVRPEVLPTTPSETSIDVSSFSDHEKEIALEVKKQLGKVDKTRWVQICEANKMTAERAKEMYKILGWD